MATNDESSNANDIRVQNLENSLQEIHKLLHVIQTKLVGGIETDKPGIVNDLKSLQEQVRLVESEIDTIKREYAKDMALAPLAQRISVIDAQLPKLWVEIDNSKKFRWMAGGGMAVVNFAFVVWEVLK